MPVGVKVILTGEKQKCSFCEQKYDVVYDGPSYAGRWAHACKGCAPGRLRFKHRELRYVKPKDGE